MTAFVQLMRRSLRARLIATFLGLLLVVQLGGYTAIRTSLAGHAERQLPVSLDVGDRVLKSLLQQRAQKLTDGARLLAADYGFREAIHSNDTDTVASVLQNHGQRIGATHVALFGTDLLLKATAGERLDALSPLAMRLSDTVRKPGISPDLHASEIALVGGLPYQFVLAPVKAPVVVGWVLMGFPVDARLVRDMQTLASVELTLLTRGSAAQPWKVQLSSLDTPGAAGLSEHRWSRTPTADGMLVVTSNGEALGTHPHWLSADAGDSVGAEGAGVLALTSLSVDEATRVPQELQIALLATTVVSCLIFGFGSAVTAHRMINPLRQLADAADRLGAGDYATPIASGQRSDEIGQLSQAFERMRISVSAQKEEILKLAYWDTLTGLPNRAQFRDAVRSAIDAAQKRGAAPGASASVAVLMLDLDRFKHVNDVLGYRFGDLLLMQVAQRLTQQSVRDGDLVARLGGDEFAILLRHGDAALAHAVATRITSAFDVPLTLEEHTVDMGAGIGMACWPQHADDAETLLSRAEIAMYSAKQRSTIGGGLLYDPTIDAASAQTLSLLTEMRQAVTENQLRLYLQPKLSLGTGLVVGAEALVRWQHPQRGLVPPMQFIPFAEQTGFIRTLTMWIFEEAVRHWRALQAEGLNITLSVNLSTRDLLDQELPQKFDALLVKHQVPAEALCLEITESAIMDDPQRAQATLDRLSALGFKLSIDDFGTGYSSLAYLKRLPVDELKIDQSFVKSMETDPDDAKIVRSTIDLAHNLGLTVVAEGIENARVWDMLRDLHCDQAQGFHMGKPMPAEAFANWSVGWLAQHRPVDVVSALMLH